MLIVVWLTLGIDQYPLVLFWSRYGAEQGRPELRRAIAETFYPGIRQADEIFVSDGAKCDAGRLQMMFGTNRSVAVQDPSYPVYVDTSVIQGSTGNYNESREGFDGIEYMLCSAENGFFPDLSMVRRHFYLCSCGGWADVSSMDHTATACSSAENQHWLLSSWLLRPWYCNEPEVACARAGAPGKSF